MGFDLDETTGASLTAGEGVKPDWFKLNKGQTVRAFILDKPRLEYIYRLSEQREDKKTGNRTKDFRGLYISLSIKDQEDFAKAEKILDAGDPNGELEIDTAYLGLPEYAASVPLIVYPEKNPKTGKIKVDNLKVVFAKLTKAKVNNLMNEIAILRDGKDKGFQEVDFFITQENKEVGTWHFRAADNSIYLEHKEKLKGRVKSLLEEELAYLNLDHPKELSKFLGYRMTAEQWHQQLEKVGYMSNNSNGRDESEFEDLEDSVIADSVSPELNDEIPALD